MTEFSAFILGVIVGESIPPCKPKSTSGSKPIRNIALQDVVFCQCLRNLVDEMDEYVKTTHPSPEEFIRHILPEDNFEQPYTEKETETIERNQRSIKGYADWIKDIIKSNSLVGGNSWDDLDAIRMIWQDEVHTPDFDELDLLFGNSLLSKPIKKNGRLYEYDTYKNNALLNGLAKGFFESIPAQIILRLCLECTQEIVGKYGYDFDFQRFDFNVSADKNGTLDEWRQEQRPIAYKMLLKDMPSFCRSTWSSYTVAVKNIDDYMHSEKQVVGKEEEKRRKEEASRICSILTADERKEFSVIDVKADPFLIALGAIFLIAIATFVIGMIVGISVPDDVEKTVTNVMLIMIAVEVCALLITFVIYIYPSKKNGGVSKKVYDYVLVLQSAYYNTSEGESAKRYKELLERANSKSRSY